MSEDEYSPEHLRANADSRLRALEASDRAQVLCNWIIAAVLAAVCFGLGFLTAAVHFSPHAL